MYLRNIEKFARFVPYIFVEIRDQQPQKILPIPLLLVTKQAIITFNVYRKRLIHIKISIHVHLFCAE